MSWTAFPSPVVDPPPASFTAVASLAVETNLWQLPAVWTPIPLGSVRAGQIWEARGGGIMSTTGTPTIIFTARIGTSATPSSNVSLGVSTAVTLPAISTSPGGSWFFLFTFQYRSLGVAATGASVTGNGLVALGAANYPNYFGGLVASVDNTTAQGFMLSATWGTSSASNTITCQWVTLRPFN